MAERRGGLRLLASVLLASAVLLWNVRFDAGVSAAASEYVSTAEAEGAGVHVGMKAFMQARVRRAAADASRTTLPLAGAAVVLLAVARRRTS